MLLYFNNEGKLVTISPHGEIPRQCGNLEIYVLFEQDYNLYNKQLWLRFKTPSKSTFEADMPMKYKDNQWEFKKLPGESIGNLVDGKKYQVYYIKLTDTLANKESGNLELVLTLYESQNQINENDEEEEVIISTNVYGKTTIYIEETLGLAPYSGVGMTYTEYQSLLNYINKLQNEVDSNRIGLLKVGDYDTDTGEIDIYYDDEIVDAYDYNEETGILTII